MTKKTQEVCARLVIASTGSLFIVLFCFFVCFVFKAIHKSETITLGRGERSCAICRSATRGTVRRLGSTRWEAIASIIIVSEMVLQMNADVMMGTQRVRGGQRQTHR